jgi:hypothetical protein
MAPSEVEHQLGAGTLWFTPLAAARLRSSLSLLQIISCPAAILGSMRFGGLRAATLGYRGLRCLVQAVRGIPLLEAWEGAIAINNAFGPTFVPWRDAVGFSACDQ